MKTPHSLHLAQVNFFKVLPQKEIADLLPHLNLVTFKRNEVICIKNSTVEKVYFLVDGIVSMTSGSDFELNLNRRKHPRKDHSFGLIWANDIIGLAGLFGETSTHLSNFLAITPVSAISINREIFVALIEKTPQAAAFVLEDSIGIQRETFNFIEAKMNGVISQLKYLQRKFKEKKYDLKETLSNQDIANIIGSSREIISRHLNGTDLQ